MKTNWIYFLVITIYITIYNVNADYRYKLRGPPLPPRPPAPPMFMKKWHMNPRFPPIRAYYNRPIVTLPAFPIYKAPTPHIIPNNIHRPKIVQPPLVIPTTVWKSPIVDTYKPTPIVAKPQFVHVAPQQANLLPEYEYHISKPEPIEAPIHQQPHTIKQIDEKGPIHTIPAPNLSLADKPIVVAEVPQNNVVQTIPSQAYQISAVHNDLNGQIQYQTQEPIQIHGFGGHNKYYAPDPDPNVPGHPIAPAVDPFSQPSNGKPPPSDLYTGADHPTIEAQQQLASQEILQLLQGYPQQQQLVDTYGLPLAQQPQLQQHILQQQIQPNQHETVHAQDHGPLFVPEPNYFAQQQQQQQQQQQSTQFHQQQYANHDFRPEYQTFNYDEQTKQNSVPSSNGFAYSEQNFNLETAGSNRIHSTATRHTQGYEQNYFPQNVDPLVASNIVDTGYNQNINLANIPDPASVYAQMLQNTNNGGGPLHYTTLPNRETAETLASLQQSGQILSKHNQNDQDSSSSNENKEYTPMRIVVPDENDEQDQSLDDDAEPQASNTNEVIVPFEQTDRNNHSSGQQQAQETSNESTNTHDTYDYEDYNQENEDSLDDVDNLTEKELENNEKLTFGARIQTKNKT